MWICGIVFFLLLLSGGVGGKLDVSANGGEAHKTTIIGKLN